MELEDLKQKWNMLDERLSKSEVYNKRVLEEVIKGKNKTTYEKLQKQGMFNFFVTLSRWSNKHKVDKRYKYQY